jgi:transposase
MEKERYLLSDMEVRRAVVLERVLERTMTIREAAEKLSLSERHVKRLKAGVKSEGAAFLAHHNRGRRPKHAIPESLRRRVVELAAGAYRGANYSHLAELMAEHDQIFLSTSSVTRILRAAGVASSRKRRPPKQHPSRPRRPRFGELVLGDGSPYAWFEERGPSCCLQGFIDDATGQVVAAVFRPHEDLQGYFEITRQMAQAHGLPLFMYTDQHTIFISNDHKLSIEEELAGHPARQPSQRSRLAVHQVRHEQGRDDQGMPLREPHPRPPQRGHVAGLHE